MAVPKKVVIFNVFGHLNMGDAMLLESLLAMIHSANSNAVVEGVAFDVVSQEKWLPQYRWHERIANKRGGRGLGAKLGQLWLLGIALLLQSSRAFYPLRRLLPRRQREAVEALASADVAVSCPGGYLEDSNFAYYLNVVQMLVASRYARTTVMAPQTVGPIVSERGRRAIAYALARVDAPFVREASSVAFVKALFPNGEVTPLLSGDLAFWYDHRSADVDAQFVALGVDPSEPVVGMTIVDWNFPNTPNPDALKQAYIEMLGHLANRAMADGRQVVLFNQVSSDLVLVDRLLAVAPGIVVDRGERDCGVLSAMIARCEVFLGSRFHSCIFALMGAVPTLAIAYLPKTTGIMADLSLSRYVVDINALERSQIDGIYDDLFARRDEISGELAQAVTAYRERMGVFNRAIAQYVA